MSKLILCIGISNCGKSDWAENYCQANHNAIEISRDKYRAELPKPYFYNQFIENEINEKIVKQFHELRRAGKDIVLSDGNLSACYRYSWVALAQNYSMDVEFVIFKSYFEKLFYGGDSKRIWELPDHVIGAQYNKFTKFLERPQNPGIIYTYV